MGSERFPRSVQLAKQCFRVLKENPILAFFPVISGLAVLVASLPFILPLTLLAVAQHHAHNTYQAIGAAQYGLGAGLYFVSTFVVIFFNAALVACAHECLQGRPTSIQFGLKAAVKRIVPILGWAAIASTVGMILRMVGERGGILGSIVTSIFGIMWNLAVFFVVPVLVIDGISPTRAIRESTAMLRRTWGERVIVGFGVTTSLVLAGLLVCIPIALAVLFAAYGWYPLTAIFGIAAVMYLLVLATVGSALATIFQTALYIYSRTGLEPGGFQPGVFQLAFQPKPAFAFFSRGR